MVPRWATMVCWSLTKRGIRQRRAQPIQASKVGAASLVGQLELPYERLDRCACAGGRLAPVGWRPSVAYG
jgi:hypothetical protein